ncbi:Ring canal kelch protein variant 1 [Trichostrongylus colubriformis]|uniref:Ring canal kelch protein variant 1 n=1 Tax=Trichostrongylus colubriformis TaxID=6319 RepID=A0AAN8F6L8_TRICO
MKHLEWITHSTSWHHGISSGHQKLLLTQLAELRHDSRLCDVTLVAKETRINAHRVVLAASSSYFKAMFTHEMAESRLKEVEIKDMEGSALDALVNFCYSGRITISPINVLSILPACCLLQLNEVQESCCEFLKKELHPLTCLGVRAFADTYACGELLRYSYQYILEHFQEIVNTEEFLLLPVEQMVELISRDELRVRSEEKVFEAVIQWVKFDMTERKRFLPRLLEQVRLPLCRPKFLVDTVSEDALVMEDIICRRLLEEAKNYQLVQLSTPVRPDMQGLRTCPRKPSKFNEVLFVVGGLRNREALDSVERLDPGKPDPSWQPVASMTKKRGGLGVAVFDNLLYAVGGRNEGEILSSIERYFIHFCHF